MTTHFSDHTSGGGHLLLAALKLEPPETVAGRPAADSAGATVFGRDPAGNVVTLPDFQARVERLLDAEEGEDLARLVQACLSGARFDDAIAMIDGFLSLDDTWDEEEVEPAPQPAAVREVTGGKVVRLNLNLGRQPVAHVAPAHVGAGPNVVPLCESVTGALSAQAKIEVDEGVPHALSVGQLAGAAAFRPQCRTVTLDVASGTIISIGILQGAIELSVGAGGERHAIESVPGFLGRHRFVIGGSAAKAGLSGACERVRLTFKSTGLDVPAGYWCTRGPLLESSMLDAPNPSAVPTLASRTPLAWEAQSQLDRLVAGQYSHGRNERAGGFERAGTNPIDGAASVARVGEHDPVGGGRNVTLESLLRACQPTGVPGLQALENIDLVTHPGAELLVPLLGSSWVLAAPRGMGDDNSHCFSLSQELRNGTRNWTTLVCPMDGTVDVMLLDPSFPHGIWIPPSTKSSFSHDLLTKEEPAYARKLARPDAGQGAASATMPNAGAL